MSDNPRVLGEGIGVSIGTAIPLETHVFIERPSVETLWFNVSTLFRNFYDSIEDKDIYNRQRIYTEFLEELNVIDSLVRSANISVRFYITAPIRTIAKLFPDAKVRLPRTDKQKIFEDLENSVLRFVMMSVFSSKVKQYTVNLPGDIDRKTHILTHNPMDLLSDYNFGYLVLLESHTGEEKVRVNWSSKLSSNEDYKYLPFNILTMQVIGDNGKNFYSLSSKVKKEYLQIASENRWTPVTHSVKVKRDIESYKGESRDLFLRLLKVKYR